MRKLFIAFDKEKKHYNIDNLDKETIKNQIFYCPYCSNPVIPKIGEHNIAHFAHKIKDCQTQKTKQQQLSDLELFKNNSISIEQSLKNSSNISPLFTCPICKSTLKKQYAIKLDSIRYICKDCIPRLRELKDL